MIISILGELIETKNIYRITRVEGDKCWMKGKPEHVQIEKKELTHSGYEFTIHFLNKKEMRVSLYGENVFENPRRKSILDTWYNVGMFDKDGNYTSNKMDYDLYLQRLSIIRSMVEKLRDKITDYWQPNQATIPRLEFDK